MTEHSPGLFTLSWSAEPYAPSVVNVPSSSGISASPFEWIDPRQIPPREWLYGRHYIRGFVSATVAASGVGKSSLTFVEALAMVTGRNLLGIEPHQPIKVWLWNEDPLIEMQRRVAAAALRYDIGESDLRDRLFLDSARDKRIVVCEQTRSGAQISAPVIDAVVRTIEQHKIGVFIVDPFVSTHEVNENDNGAIERVTRAWCEVAERTGAAVELVHHARKSNGSSVSIDDARGASAWIAATRSARVINPMGESEAKKASIESDDRRRYFRVENGKASIARPSDRSEWYFLDSIDLGNQAFNRPSDQVGVATPWEWPASEIPEVTRQQLWEIQMQIGKGKCKANMQAADWAGRAVADVLKLDVGNPKDKDAIKAMLKKWESDGYFKTDEIYDTKKSRNVPVYRIGEAVIIDSIPTS